MTEAHPEAAAHGGGGFDPSSILHHVQDSNSLEVPFFPDVHIPLPTLQLFGVDLSITKHVVMMWVASAILIVLFRLAARRASDPVPGRLRNALEVLLLFIRDDVARRSIPHGADRYVGYLLSTFFFIATCNLLGLVPGMATATGNISVTAALALAAFVMIQLGGIREFGLLRHMRNLVPQGLPAALVPLMVVIEFLSMLIRPFALCIRLFANMMAGHVVIGAFISLVFILGWVAVPVAVAFALFVHFLELLVCFLQAYIFTMLTATFIGMSVHPH